MRSHGTAGCLVLAGLLLSTNAYVSAQVATLSTTTVKFGNQAIMTTSAAKSVRLTNTGTAPLMVSSITPPSAPFADPKGTGACPSASFSLAPATYCTISVTFSPTTTGSFTGSISITDNAPTSPQTIILPGTGVPQARLSTTNLNFGNQGVGSPATKMVTLSNNLNVPLTFGGATASGDFTTTAAPTNPCGASVPAGGHCSIGVTFTPSKLGIGSGTLTVTDSASNNPQTATLTGTGTASSVTSISVLPVNSTIPVGGTQPFTAIGTFPGSITLDLTTLVTWSSSSTKVASISNTAGSQGVATGKAAGTTTIKATLNKKYSSTSLTVTAGGLIKPTISWVPASPIIYGTALGGAQLDATASSGGIGVLGSYAYSPALGAVLPAGNQTLSVTFTPTDTTHYTTATASVIITINKATPSITWATPAPITYGATLSTAQLNATASVPGKLVYTPDIGTTPTAGTDTLSVTFTPTDTTDYATATSSVTLTVSKATPTITWATPAPITYGTTLSSAQLNATASVPGKSVYTPDIGTTPEAGTDTLSVTFSPTDTADYTTATATVVLTVNPAITLDSIALTPTNFSFALGATPQQFTATGTYSDHSTAPLTTGVTWSSSATNVATITADGSATAVGLGVTTISATVGSIQSATNLAVTGTGTFIATGSLKTARDPFTATVLLDGTVLMAGGFSNGGVAVNSFETYDAAGSSSSPGDPKMMTVARADHTATLLNNGEVLLVGGYDDAYNLLGSAELYDGASFQPNSGSLHSPRASHTATLLSDGSVLIIGGIDSTGGPTRSVELYDPGSKTFSVNGNLNFARSSHTATLLPDGTVLVAGGFDSDLNPLNTAEIYDPGQRSSTAIISMNYSRAGHTATLVNDGTVLLAGGIDNISYDVTGTAEVYHGGAFNEVGNYMSDLRYQHTATPLGNGMVLLAGGATDSSGTPTSSADLYNPGTGFTPTTSLLTPRYGHTATLLTNGSVLIAGGTDSSGNAIATAELYQPSTLTPDGLQSITITPITQTVAAGTAQQFMATGNFANYNQFLPVTWSSSDTTVAEVSNDSSNQGVALGLKQGTVTITAYLGAIQGSATLIVGPPALASVAVTPVNLSRIPVGGIVNCILMGTYTDGTTQPLTADFWSSDSPAVMIDATGRATGVAVGLANISATYEGLSASTRIDVTNFSPGPDLVTARSNHTATLLLNGQVLVTGGLPGYYSGPSLSSAELFDPVNNSFTPTSNELIHGVFYHTATLLTKGPQTGWVLIAGGQLDVSSPNATTQAELYEPSSGGGVFEPLSGLTTPRQSHTATLLADDYRVLIVGGYSQSVGDAVNTAEIYNAIDNTFTPTKGHLATARYGHSATLLQDGRVLIVGGFSFATGELFDAELYDPKTDTFSPAGQTAAAGLGHTATLLPTTGQVLIAGGIFGAGIAPSPSGVVELYTPDPQGQGPGTFASTGILSTGRYFHTATLQNGKVLITGGQVDGNGTPTADVEVYDPGSGTFAPAGTLIIPRDAHTATRLSTGSVLITGGVVSSVIPAPDTSTLSVTLSTEIYPVAP